MRKVPALLLTTAFFLFSAILEARGEEEKSSDKYWNRYIRYFDDGNIRIGQKQIWSLCEGADGFMFFAFNEGLAMYDGMRWRLFQTPDKTAIRALHWDNASERLYSSGENEFGYWTLDNFGEMRYTCLFRNERFRELTYYFNRIAFPAGSEFLLFQSHNVIIVCNIATKELSFIEPSHSFAYMHTVGSRVYVQDGRQLLLLHVEGAPEKICELDSRVINMFDNDQGELILAIEHLGLFTLDGGYLSPLDTQTNKTLASAKIISCIPYGRMILVGTTREGMFALDAEGRIVKGFCNDKKLSKATVLALGIDSQSNIWLGMGAGVAMIDNSSGEYYILSDEIGQVQGIIPYGECLLAGTNKGLFVLSPEGEIEIVPGSQGAVWQIEKIGDGIFILHDQGIFLFEDGALVPVRNVGTMSIKQLFNDKRFFVASDYNGFSLYEFAGGRLKFVNAIENYGGRTSNFFIDRSDKIWLPVHRIGFVRLTLSDDKSRIEEIRNFDIAYSNTDKTTLCTLIDGEPVFYAEQKAYAVNYIKDTLEYNSSYTELLRMCGTGLSICKQIGDRFWYISERDVGYIERSPGGVLTKFSGLFCNIYDRRLTSDFFRVGSFTAVGFYNGFGIAASARKTANRMRLGVIEAYGTKERMLYDRSKSVFDIPADMNNLRIYPVRPTMSRMFEYRIEGLYDGWTSVRVDDCLQLASLPSGTYTIRVRQAEHPPLLNHGEADSFNIRVARPWYFTLPAFACYMLIVVAVLMLIRLYYHRKNRRAEEQIRQIEQERRRRELEKLEKENLLKEKRITELETERLRSDIREKDKRLANLTMNSVKRNGMLGELKQQIADLSGLDNAVKIKSSLAMVVRRINAMMSDDEDWPLAEKYFNTIHDGLLDRLRALRPNLSQTDLKLCVYIKLNLSTKEIAEIMNVSPRSVEMARYRLRKKLGLNPDESIVDALK